MSDKIGISDLGWITDPKHRDYAAYATDQAIRRTLAAIGRGQDVDELTLASMIGCRYAVRVTATRGELTDLGRDRLDDLA
jgi:hypothetical protein